MSHLLLIAIILFMLCYTILQHQYISVYYLLAESIPKYSIYIYIYIYIYYTLQCCDITIIHNAMLVMTYDDVGRRSLRERAAGIAATSHFTVSFFFSL